MGPYLHPPFDNMQLSPISLKEKSTPGKYRILHNLSYPHDGTSINSCISEKEKSVNYSSINDAIRILCSIPLCSYSAKSDIKNAFGIIPIHPSDQMKLGFVYNKQYYYSRTLPQGAASSCRIFEMFATALQHIVTHHANNIKMLHYLDDFLFIGDTKSVCQTYLDIFHHICKTIGIPLSPEKTTLPSTNTIFLGIELDSSLQCARLPQDKLISYSSDVQSVLNKRTITKRSLQSIIGKLNFATSVVPGRAFMRRLINLLPLVSKPHHYINLSVGSKLDLQMWFSFLQSYNGITFFRAISYNSHSLSMASDACKIGFGATFRTQWIQASYPVSWQSYNIAILELYPIYVMLKMFSSCLTNSTLKFYCDNEAVCYILNKLSSKDNMIMQIIRDLVLCLLKYNIHIIGVHLPGKNNHVCDKISRFQMTADNMEKLGLNRTQTTIPDNLLPGNYAIECSQI